MHAPITRRWLLAAGFTERIMRGRYIFHLNGLWLAYWNTKGWKFRVTTEEPDETTHDWLPLFNVTRDFITQCINVMKETDNGGK